MRIKLLNTELFIKANHLKEIRNPIILDRGSIPTSDGLLSTEIFGITPKERKTTYAYINLQGHFLQPLVYKQLKRLDGRIDALISGMNKFSINKNGELVEDAEGNTGLEWLYENWEKIKWKRNNSRIRSERIDLLEKYGKDELFTKYFIVIPAFYRDINLQKLDSGKPSLHEINSGSDQTNGSSYSKLLRLTSTLKMGGSFAFALNNTKFQIQLCIVDIYNYFKSRIEKKFGIIRKGLLGKSVDYGSRLVISAPHINAEKYDDMIVDFSHVGIPLSKCIANATPFVIGWLSNFFKNEFEAMGNKYPIIDKDGKITYEELANPEAYFNDAYLEKLMKKFIYSYSERFDRIELPLKSGKKCYMIFKGHIPNLHSDEKPKLAGIGDRYMTITDLFYLCAVDVYQNKNAVVTRYPISTMQSLFTSKVRPLSTIKTCQMSINGKIYNYYPVIEEGKDPSTLFIEVLMMSNTLLDTLGADYDGDTTFARTVFSQEANLECERLQNEPTMVLNANGNPVRTSSKEAIQTIYDLTK